MAEYILVAGSRTFVNDQRLAEILGKEIKAGDTIVEGGAKGVDTMARQWAEENGVSYMEFKADWKRYGKAAGPKRNDQMTEFIAEHGGRAVYIWDGKSKGTKQCIESAMARQIPTNVYLETEE